jgi:hypothetical protein
MKLAAALLAFLWAAAPLSDLLAKDNEDEHKHHEHGPKAPLPWKADPFPSTYAPLPRTDTLIVDATVLDGAGRRFEHASDRLAAVELAAVGGGNSHRRPEERKRIGGRDRGGGEHRDGRP